MRDQGVAVRAVADLLTLDRGNSCLDAMLHSEPVWRRRWPVDAELADLDWLPAQPTRIAALSVVPGGLDRVCTLAAAAGISIAVAGEDLKCPLRLDYPDPASLGVDRWVSAVAARELYGTALVVDCGTAVTVNLVTEEGRFLGGAIAPGPYTLAAALAVAAPALPAVDFDGPAELPAVDSSTAVNAGLGVGFCGMVDGLVDAVLAAAATGVHSGSLTVVLTGGGAPVYRRFGRRDCRFEPALVHLGLRWLIAHQTSNS